MTESEKARRLIENGLPISEAGALRFVQLWEAMKEVDREEAEEDRVEHAREMSQPRR